MVGNIIWCIVSFIFIWPLIISYYNFELKILYPIVSHTILYHPIISYPILTYPILSYTILYYAILSYIMQYLSIMCSNLTIYNLNIILSIFTLKYNRYLPDVVHVNSVYNRNIIEKQPRPVTGEIYNYISKCVWITSVRTVHCVDLCRVWKRFQDGILQLWGIL